MTSGCSQWKHTSLISCRLLQTEYNLDTPAVFVAPESVFTCKFLCTYRNLLKGG